MKVGFFVDIENLWSSIIKAFPGQKLDFTSYRLQALDVGDEFYRMVAYGTQETNEAVPFMDFLRAIGFDVNYRQTTGRYRSSAAGIAIDVVRYIGRLDLVIIGSANPDMIHVVRYCKSLGVKVGVYACGICRELRNEADWFLEIEENQLVNSETAQ